MGRIMHLTFKSTQGVSAFLLHSFYAEQNKVLNKQLLFTNLCVDFSWNKACANIH